MTRQAEPTTDELRDRVQTAWQSLRRQRSRSESKGELAGGDLAATEAAYHQAVGEYARRRIARGLGPDPQVIEAEVFDDILYALAEPARFAKQVSKTRPTSLARETMTLMLSSGVTLGETLAAARSATARRDSFGQTAPLKEHLRGWANRAASDPFVEACLKDVGSRQADFSRAVADADTLLNKLKVKLEREQGGAGRMAVVAGEDGGAELMATYAWDALVKASPDDAQEVFAAVAAAELAAGRIEHAAKDINRELSRFFAELVPRYFALISTLPRPRRKELTGGVRLTPALAARLVDAADGTDFVCDLDLALGFERRALPRRLRLIKNQRGYRRVHEMVAGRKVQDASTVVVRRSGPAAERSRRQTDD